VCTKGALRCFLIKLQLLIKKKSNGSVKEACA